MSAIAKICAAIEHDDAGVRLDHDEMREVIAALDAAETAAGQQRTRADAAEAEVARLRTIVEGRSAPSDAEMREHMDAGGVWLVTEPAVRGLRPTPVTHYVESYARATVLWWTEGARWVAVRDGRPCAWPSPRSEGP